MVYTYDFVKFFKITIVNKNEIRIICISILYYNGKSIQRP